MKKSSLGWWGIVILSALPAVFWLGMMPLSARFAGGVGVMSSIGQLLGLTGMVMFSLIIILSARFKFLEDYFGGMNRSYVAHHWLGGLSFIFLLFHPVVLALRMLYFSASEAFLFLLPSGEPSVDTGIYALAVMIIGIVITFYFNFRYERWHFTHKFLGLAYIIAGGHILLISSDISRSMPLRIYMVAMFAVGLAAFLYRTILNKYLVKKFSYFVSGVEKFGSQVCEITLAPAGEEIKYQPGQFAFFKFESEELGWQTHPFSFSSSPTDSEVKIAVKNLGDFTAKLMNVKQGTGVKIEGPYGRFLPNDKPHNQVWIAGGIGITPFLSSVRSMRDNKAKKVVLFYCVNNAEEAVCLDEMKQSSVDVSLYESDAKGHITVEFVKRKVGNLADFDYYLCGPAGMMQALRGQLVAAGVSNRKIYSEEFSL